MLCENDVNLMKNEPKTEGTKKGSKMDPVPKSHVTHVFYLKFNEKHESEVSFSKFGLVQKIIFWGQF